jgi:putative metallohydrolase (TIGR04338 family)
MTPQRSSPRPDRPRDVGRAAVYAGENQVARILDRSAEFPVVDVAGSRITLPPERHFGDLAAVQRYVDGVLALGWVRRRWPAAAQAVMVRERQGASKAHYAAAPRGARSEQSSAATIAVPVRGADARWALRELVVLHEIAHHLGSSGPGAADDGHGPDFTARMLELTGGVMGEEIAFLLRVARSDQGVVIG